MEKSTEINPYVDKYGQWHVKPCIDGEPSGNDGLIISAYAEKVGLYVDWVLVKEMFVELATRTSCFTSCIPIERTPGKKTPTPSRDFFLGSSTFKFMHYWFLEERNWNFCPYKLPKFNPFKLVCQLYKLRGKHRNTMWEEPGYEQVWYTGYRIPLQDRAYHIKRFGDKPNWFYRLYAWIDSKLKPGSDSGALIRWLKYDIEPPEGTFERYFGEHHPITLAYKTGVYEQKKENN